jgi:CSLREA domain-containing protein
MTLLLAALVAAPTPRAYAATLSVTKTADTNDGLCNSDCSLREAINTANANPGADTILLPAGSYTLTIPPGANDDNSGDLDIREQVTITGAGAATTTIVGVAGAAGDRVLELHAGAVTITGVTIRGGRSDVDGGGILVRPTAALTLRDSIVRDNTAADLGGGIAVGGDIDIGGGALTIERVTIHNNTARIGGGVSAFNAGALTLANATLSANSVVNSGGGMAVFSSTVTLNNSTFTANIADSNADNGGEGGGIFNNSDATVTLANTLIAANVDASPTTKHPDCSGIFQSERYNLIQDLTGCLRQGFVGGDVVEQDARLAPLAVNGGAIPVHALLGDSPALDAGNPDAAQGGVACAGVDARGVARPIDADGDTIAVCDIGAFEAIATDLALQASAAPLLVRSGGPMSYQLTLRNLGPTGLPAATARLQLAAGASYTGAGGAGWSCSASGATVDCIGPTLAAGATAPLLTIATIAPPGTASFSATATIGAGVVDNQAANNSVTITTLPAIPNFVPLLGK